MMNVVQWEERLYPHSFDGVSLRKYVHSHFVYTCCLNAEDRKFLKLIQMHEWEYIARFVHAELRAHKGWPNDPAEPAGKFFHVTRRVIRPKKIMQFNRMSQGSAL